jgi:glycosyltransferase involved in cell wall biosynthesis
VLSEAGARRLRARRGLSGVQVIPHVVDPQAVWARGPGDGVEDVLFFGFIGRSKGLEYALALHARIRRTLPMVGMHVVGQAAPGRDQAALDVIRDRFSAGVTYHGFVPEDRLDAIFARCAHAFLPFAASPWLCPVSGSILHGLWRGRIVWTSDVNAAREIIDPGVNGLFLTGNVGQDVEAFLRLHEGGARRASIAAAALETARRRAAFDFDGYFGRDAA